MRLALIAIVMGGAALALGCRDSADTLTLEEYFAELEAIDNDLSAQFEEVFARLPEDMPVEEFLADEANLLLVKDYFATLPPIIGDTVDRLKALDAPSEVEKEHDALVDAGENFVVALENDNEFVNEAETMAEFDALTDQLNTIFGLSADRFEEACLDLLAVGEAHGIIVDSATCEDEASSSDRFMDSDAGYSFDHAENIEEVPADTESLFLTGGFAPSVRQFSVSFPQFEDVPRLPGYKSNAILVDFLDVEADATQDVESNLPALAFSVDQLIDDLGTFSLEDPIVGDIPSLQSSGQRRGEAVSVEHEQFVVYSYDYAGKWSLIWDVRGRIYFLIVPDRIYRVVCQFEAFRFERAVADCDSIVETMRHSPEQT